MTQYTPKAALPYAELPDASNMQTYTQGLTAVLDGVVCPVYADRTTRDATNPSPTTGDVCFVTADQRQYRYYNAQWNNQTIYFGTASITSSGSGNFFQTVTFSSPAFEFAPSVWTNIASGSGATAGCTSRADSPTTTNFRLNVFTATDGGTITWSGVTVWYWAL